ncbi:hypothetical protein U1Q18_028363, partial [Sarracenia purpurea var. burkii]
FCMSWPVAIFLLLRWLAQASCHDLAACHACQVLAASHASALVSCHALALAGLRMPYLWEHM